MLSFVRGPTLVDLRRARAERKPVGPEGNPVYKPRISATALRSAILEGTSRSEQIILRATIIDGDLDLSYTEVVTRLRFEQCEFRGRLELAGSELTRVEFVNCTFRAAIDAIRCSVKYHLVFDGSHIAGPAWLSRAKIGGMLIFDDAIIGTPATRGATMTLHLDGITVDGSASMVGVTVNGPVSMAGAVVKGRLQLSNGTLSVSGNSRYALAAEDISAGAVLMDKLHSDGSILISRAQVDGPIVLTGASIFPDATGRALVATSVEVGADLIAPEARFWGSVRLFGADIRGHVMFQGATFDSEGADRVAVQADQLTTGGRLVFRSARIAGEVRLLASKVGGQVTFDRARMCLAPADGPAHDVLSIDGSRIAGSVYLTNAVFLGSIRVPACVISGDLLVERSSLRYSPSSEASLEAAGARIEGNFFGDGLDAVGEVDLDGVTIEGQMFVIGATMRTVSPARPALSLDRATIGGGMNFSSCDVHGEVRMANSDVGAQLVLQRCRIESASSAKDARVAFYGDGTSVRGIMDLSRSHFIGETRMIGAELRGQLVLKGAVVEARRGNQADSLVLDTIRIGGGVFANGLRSFGTVRFSRATIDAEADFDGSRVIAASDSARAISADGVLTTGGIRLNFARFRGAVALSGATVRGQLGLLGVTLIAEPEASVLILALSEIDELLISPLTVTGSINLERAQITSLWDAERESLMIPSSTLLNLKGTRYDLREPLDARRRLPWIDPSDDDPYFPGVYRDLAEVFRRNGQNADARQVLLAGERRARWQYPAFSLRGLWQDFLWVTVGNGYRNSLAGFWLLTLILIGAICFHFSGSSFKPNETNPHAFSSLLYAIDVTVPVVEFGQQEAWSPTGADAWVALALTISGYALAAAVIAAATQIFSRTDRSV